MVRSLKSIASLLLAALVLALCAFPGAVHADTDSWEPAEETNESPAGEETEEPEGSADPAEEGTLHEEKTAQGAEIWLRIGLKYGSSAVSTSKLYSEDGFVLVTFAGDAPEVLLELPMYSELTACVSGGKAALTDPDGDVLAELSENDVLLCAAEDPELRIMSIDGSLYRDGVSFVLNGTKLNVINRITLEHYLRGVVPNEMGYLYPAEALKCQAVTARSFAASNIGHHGSSGFDLCTGDDCQVYKGVASEREQTTAACLDTEGVVMTYDGKIATGYYYAYSAGYTMNSEDVWSSQPGYLKGVDDPYSGDYLWKASCSFEELEERLVSLGYKCGEIESVSVSNRHSNGAVKTVLIETSKGEIELSKSKITSVLGKFGVKSQSFYIGNSDYPAKGEQQVGKAYIEDGKSLRPSDTVFVLGGDGIVHEAEASGLFAVKKVKTLPLFSVAGDEYADEEAEDGTVYFTGFGYGHGVGMPQVSARNMAQDGMTCEEILKHFYTGIELEEL